VCAVSTLGMLQPCERTGVRCANIRRPVELTLDTSSARLVDPDDHTSFAVVVEGDGEPAAAALAAAGVVGLGDHAWVRTDALRRLAGPAATDEWERSFVAMLDYARTRGWVDDELGAVRGHVERRALRTPRAVGAWS
jgi:hypothetical protein